MDNDIIQKSAGINREALERLMEENRLLRAANDAAAIIIGGFHQEYEMVLNQALQTLGESVHADCACIFRNFEQDDQQWFFLRARWSKGAHAIKDKDKPMFRYDEFLPGWQEYLEKDQYLVLGAKEIPTLVKEAFSRQSAKSILLAPLYLHSDFWGMIGFVRREKKLFTVSEADIMKAGAMIVASSISRNETFGKLNQARNEAVASTQAKGEFLSRMSHEMRTPLNAVIGMTGIAKKENDASRIQYCLDKIETSSRQLLNIINDVLDMSKIDAGKLEIEEKPYDFLRMLESAVNIAKVNMDQKQQRFTVECNMPFTRMVIGDEYRMSQIIINLLNNAMKFTPEHGEIALKVLAGPVSQERINLRVEVWDTGIGVSPDQKEKLFQSFEQADGSITRKYGGTGLGLSICKQILNIMGGDIWVVSKPDQGACFFFEVEMDVGEALEETSSLELRDDNSAGEWANRTILLAEDVEINREIVEIILEETRVRIVSVGNGLEAIERFAEEPGQYDLILMDVQMPILDGLGATRQIRELNIPCARQIPIIAMTANAFKEDVENCINAGMNDHIAKPLDTKLFFEVLRKYLK